MEHLILDAQYSVKSFIRTAVYARLQLMTRKNPHAVAMGKKGGKARWEALSAEERSELMRKAVQARWEKAKKKTG